MLLECLKRRGSEDLKGLKILSPSNFEYSEAFIYQSLLR